jgi:DNA-binding NtrC family response regulator
MNSFITQELIDFLKIKFGIVGFNGPMGDAIQSLVQSAPTELSVLITGETGTGKEVFANAIHGLSKRKNKPFVSVNCGAIPETLLESELFGHEKGAYTSADSSRKGFFETADKGTIFLDEIGDMPYSTQVKLLRILESGEFSRLGSSDVKKVDVRIIAATNRNLEYEVQRNNFRQDLFYRLKNVHIQLPSLNEHIDDIPILLDYFIEKIAKKLSIPPYPIDRETVELLKIQNWVGNVREFKNLIETIITLEKTSDITPKILRKYLTPALPPAKDFTYNPYVPVKIKDSQESELSLIFRTLLEIQNNLNEVKHITLETKKEISQLRDEVEKMQYEYKVIEDKEIDISSFENMTFDEIERVIIQNVIDKYDGNRRKAAQALGINERTLYRKLARWE